MVYSMIRMCFKQTLQRQGDRLPANVGSQDHRLPPQSDWQSTLMSQSK